MYIGQQPKAAAVSHFVCCHSYIRDSDGVCVWKPNNRKNEKFRKNEENAVCSKTWV